MGEPDTTQLLEQLRDIHQPAPPPEPSIWPIVIASLIIAIAISAVMFRYRRQLPRSWASAAIVELDAIQRQSGPTARLETAELLKRIVLTHNNRADIRQLHGSNWLRYLDQFFNTRFFSEGGGKIYGDSLYQADAVTDIDCSFNYKKLRTLIKKRNRLS